MLEVAIVAQMDEADLVKPAAYIVLTAAARRGVDFEQELREHCKRGWHPTNIRAGLFRR